MWQWNQNPDNNLWSLTERPAFLTLNPGSANSLFEARNTFTATLQDESLEVTTRLDTTHLAPGDNAGLSAIGVHMQSDTLTLYATTGGHETPSPNITTPFIQLRATINKDTATYSYSLNEGQTFLPLGDPQPLVFSWWKATRIALFAFNTDTSNGGTTAFDLVHFQPLHPNPVVR